MTKAERSAYIAKCEFEAKEFAMAVEAEDARRKVRAEAMNEVVQECIILINAPWRQLAEDIRSNGK